MSTEITAANDNRTVEFSGQSLGLGQLMEVAKVMAASNLLPQALRGKPADVFITIMYGQELNFTPMQAIQGIYVVNGRPSLAGQTWLSLVRKAGHRVSVTEHTEKACTVTITRGDTGEEHTETFTWDEAVRAKLTKKDVWTSWPKRMLLWRAVSSCATVICPEVALGFELQGAESPLFDEVPRPTLGQVAAERTDRADGEAPPAIEAAKDPEPEQDDDAMAAELDAMAREHQAEYGDGPDVPFDFGPGEQS